MNFIKYWTKDIVTEEGSSMHVNYYVDEDGNLGYFVSIFDWSNSTAHIIACRWFKSE